MNPIIVIRIIHPQTTSPILLHPHSPIWKTRTTKERIIAVAPIMNAIMQRPFRCLGVGRRRLTRRRNAPKHATRMTSTIRAIVKSEIRWKTLVKKIDVPNVFAQIFVCFFFDLTSTETSSKGEASFLAIQTTRRGRWGFLSVTLGISFGGFLSVTRWPVKKLR